MERMLQEQRNGGILPLFIAKELTVLYLRPFLFLDKPSLLSLDPGKIFLDEYDPLNIRTLRAKAFYGAWILASRIPSAAFDLLMPSRNQNEPWVRPSYLDRIQQNAHLPREREALADRIDRLSQSCWHDIQQKRRYAIPAEGRAEILVHPQLHAVFGLTSVRFVQEGIMPPGVWIRLHFGKVPRRVGLVKVTSTGAVEGFHELCGPLLKAAVQSLVLTYYRDLVTPGATVVPALQRTSTPRTGTGTQRLIGHRQLPRPDRVYDFRQWHHAQSRAAHYVTGHFRWVSDGFEASQEKHQEAREAGDVTIPTGYTWVTDHERGKVGQLQLQNGNLMHHTVFAAPHRASRELIDLFL